MKTVIHWVLQSKGGCGKSFTALVLLQYLRARLGEDSVIGIDMDIANHTLSSFKTLKSEYISVESDTREGANHEKLDGLVTRLCSAHPGAYVLDSGASVFNAVYSFLTMRRCENLKILYASDFEIIVHVPMAGGEFQLDCRSTLCQLLDAMPFSQRFVIWINDGIKGRVFGGKYKELTDDPQLIEHEDQISELRLDSAEMVLDSSVVELIREMSRNYLCFEDLAREDYAQAVKFQHGVWQRSAILRDHVRSNNLRDYYFGLLDAVQPPLISKQPSADQPSAKRPSVEQPSVERPSAKRPSMASFIDQLTAVDGSARIKTAADKPAVQDKTADA